MDCQSLLKDVIDAPNVTITEHTSLSPQSDTATEAPNTGQVKIPNKKKKIGARDTAYGQKQRGQARGPIGTEPENQQRQDAAYFDPRRGGELTESTSGE